ncbi:MAG: hypothetical protein WA131_02450 [Desulfitobacteriaceae bacterium]
MEEIIIFNDLLIDGAVAGAVATIIASVVNYLLYKANQIDNHCIQFCAAVMLPEIKPLTEKKALIVGFFGHITVGMLFGLLIALVLQIFGPQYAYLKGMGVGLAFWVFVHQVVVAKFLVKPNYNLSPKGALWQLMIHLLQGIIVVLILSF